jgi:hypothetical protein
LIAAWRNLAFLARCAAWFGFALGVFLVKRILVYLKSKEKSNSEPKQPENFFSTRFYPVDFSTCFLGSESLPEGVKRFRCAV